MSSTLSAASEEHLFQDNEIKDFDFSRRSPIPTQELLSTISQQISRLIAETDKEIDTKDQTNFYASQKPSISILDYLKRIQKFTECSEVCFLLALIYIDRIQERKSEIILNSYTTHRFLLIGIVIAMKFYEDKFYKNEYYAKVGGISKESFNQLEVEFLELCDYELHVKPYLFEQYYDTIASKKCYCEEEGTPTNLNTNNPNIIISPTITTQFSNFLNFYNMNVYENYRREGIATEIMSQ